MQPPRQQVGGAAGPQHVVRRYNFTAQHPRTQFLAQCDGLGTSSDRGGRDRVVGVRGWRLDKMKQAHKIDVVVALSMAALAAVRDGGKSRYDLACLG